MRRHVQRWIPWALGMALGATLVMAIPLLRGMVRRHFGGDSAASDLPLPETRVKGDSDDDAALPISGNVRTTLDDFTMDDPEGHRVVHIRHLEAKVNADAMRTARLHMPEGEASGIALLLRRGLSGHVSLTEGLKANPEDEPAAEQPDPAAMHLDIGPLEAHDILLTIAMSDSPVVVHIDRAMLQVQRTRRNPTTRVFLSGIQGRLVKPDPLPNPIEIHDGHGVVDLGEDPLVDMRVRVCLARGELRLGIRVPARQAITHLTVDGDRFMGHTAMAALGLVGRFKDNLEVERAEVKVEGHRECEGRTGGKDR